MTELRLPAIEIDQGNGRKLYSFAVDGKQVSRFAEVSRIRRGGKQEVLGYQRPEVTSHIAEIRNYLESEAPMIPNSVVIAFDESVSFEPADSSSVAYAQAGTIVIPSKATGSKSRRPGWIVDGQQRLAAVRAAKVESFPLSVVSFIAKNVADQRDQFILVNSTKPLPKGLVYELLPETEGTLPSLLARRRFPAYLMNRLNSEADSPMRGRIRTPTNPDGVIKDNSVLRMIENSLTDGALYRFRAGDNGDGDADSMVELLQRFWTAVASIFPDAWNLKPRRSRLVHGAGIVAMGFVMDAATDKYRNTGIPTTDTYVAELQPLVPTCRWTDGFWEFGPGAHRRWNEIQNTSKDVTLLANYLLLKYRQSELQPTSK